MQTIFLNSHNQRCEMLELKSTISPYDKTGKNFGVKRISHVTGIVSKLKKLNAILKAKNASF